MSKKRMIVSFTGATPIIGNRGVGALALGSMQIIASSFPTTDYVNLNFSEKPTPFTFIDNDGSIIEVGSINIRFSKYFWHKNNIAILLLGAVALRILPLKSFRQKLLSILPVLNAINQIDYSFSIAGGDSFTDIYGLQRFLFVVLTKVLLIILKKPLILLPQTYGPFNTTISRIIARFIFRKAEYIFARDEESLKYVQNKFLNSCTANKIGFNYDVGFILQPHKPSNWDRIEDCFRDKKVVGINVSGLLYKGGYTRNNQFGLKTDYPAFIDSVIKLFTEDMKVPVILVPHVFGCQLESDESVCREIGNRLKIQCNNLVLFLDQVFDQNEIKYIIGKCDFFIGARMHACIAALSQCIPTIPVAYSRKFSGIMESIGAEELVADARTLGTNEILSFIYKHYNDKERIRAKLSIKIPDVKKSVFDMISIIKQYSQTNSGNKLCNFQK